MWAVTTAIMLSTWGLTKLLFAIVRPPHLLAPLMRVSALFEVVPAPWDRRLSLTFDAALAFAVATLVAYYGLVA